MGQDTSFSSQTLHQLAAHCTAPAGSQTAEAPAVSPSERRKIESPLRICKIIKGFSVLDGFLNPYCLISVNFEGFEEDDEWGGI
ncbi:hypothetical protein Hanom_Chr16g01487261 [Helianthus anomalus]